MDDIFLRRVAIVVLTAALGACANMGESVRDAVSAVASTSVGPPAQERVRTAMDLLERGDEAHARSLLESTLRQEPGNATARRLLDEITDDPRAQLGARSTAYAVRAGDTMSGLAERFVGDPLMFYALARYNQIAPNQLSAGQTIQVPVRNRPNAAPARTTSVSPALPAIALAPSPSPVVTQASARANQLRLQGLEHLNAGDADGAVNLLRRAHDLDSSNNAVQNDLTRALRIQASLTAH